MQKLTRDMNDKSPAEQIDDIIKLHGGWKGDLIKDMRAVITAADPRIVEEIKWKMATRPEGLAVWSCNGIVCFVEVWKDNLKLIFFKGAQLDDPSKLFNARLKSSSVRAIELHDGDSIDEAGLTALVVEAVALNTK